jgi:CheY-like chemotaxis protein
MDRKVFLLVDDDVDDTEMFIEALAGIDNSIKCHNAVDGRVALEKLNELDNNPNLIFLDINMPVMNGWQFLKIIKEDERYKQIPVIVISTSSHQRETTIALELGALCYLTKPNDFEILKNVLQLIVKHLDEGLPNALQNIQAVGSAYIVCNHK